MNIVLSVYSSKCVNFYMEVPDDIRTLAAAMVAEANKKAVPLAAETPAPIEPADSDEPTKPYIRMEPLTVSDCAFAGLTAVCGVPIRTILEQIERLRREESSC